MRELTENFWRLIEEQYEKIVKYDKDFIFQKNKHEEFHKYFKEQYYYIKNKYMHSKVEFLDRHKVAALLITCSLEKEIIDYKNKGDKFFIGAQLLTLRAALAYMFDKMNEKLMTSGKEIETLELPESVSCDTNYIEIMCRNLYYAKKDYMLNPLELAEKLFLLEQYWLAKANIDPKLLKTDDQA